MSISGIAPTAATRSRALPVAGPSAPPYALVVSHFAISLVWLMLGCLGLVVLAPTLAKGIFLDPRVLALTHTITLGFLTTVVMGVLYQIYPAMLGVSCRSIRLAWGSLAGQTLGTTFLVAGLWTGTPWLMAWAWTLLFAATFGVSWNILPLRRKATRNRQIGAYVSYGHSAFGLAMALGGARIGDALGWWTTPRLGLLSAHFQLAAIGFGGLTAMGVGSRMIPMFLGADSRDGWELRWIPRIMMTGLVIFAAGELGVPALDWIGAGLIAAAALLFLLVAQGWLSRSRSSLRDPTIWYLVTALAALAGAIPMGFGAMTLGLRNPGLQVAYPALVLMGWLAALTIGVSYKILPNLTWHYRFSSRIRNPDAPPVSALLTPALGRASAILYSLGLLVLIPALAAGSGEGARVGGLALSSAVGCTLAHHVRLARLHSFDAAPTAEDRPALRRLR